MMAINVVMLVIFVAAFASLMNNGLWSNMLMLVNVLTAGLLAMNYFEPLADWLDQQAPSLTYLWDFIAIWAVFIVAMLALRAATDYMSVVKVRFIPQLDRAGGTLLALWVSWVLLGFATASLHTSPLARNFLGGAFQPNPQDKMLWGLAPDRRWLAWVHRESQGPLCRLNDISPFDPQGDFILRYGKRREAYEEQLTLTTPKGGAPAGLQLP
jgi:hypothetical protein